MGGGVQSKVGFVRGVGGGVQSKMGFVRGVWRDCLYSVSCVTGQLCAPVCVGVAESCGL